MAREVAQKYQDKLKEYKDNIEKGYKYFKKNYDRYILYRDFVFNTSLTDEDIATLAETKKPAIEFNILESYISRLRGEFSKQIPCHSVRPQDGAKVDPQTIQVVDFHLRAVFKQAMNDNLAYDIYTEMLSGGFSTVLLYTDYANDMSFDQNIYLRKAFDPTMCVWDPTARLSHKGDGRYCSELYPLTRDAFEDRYGKGLLDKVKFNTTLMDFKWTYTADEEEVVLVARYFYKSKKRTKIMKLANGQVVTEEDYKRFAAYWEENRIISAIPAVVGKPRWTDVEKICYDDLTNERILDHKETDMKFFPLIFFDGNSQNLRMSTSGGGSMQFTRPYIYHAMGVQKLKNFAGSCLANELENMVQHKFMVPKEGIPAQYLDAYENVQKANVLVYNQFNNNDPDQRLDPPQAVPRIPAPPEVTGTFSISDEVTQHILGSYDAALGINNNELSGKAIVEAATQSNAAAMPYIVSFLKGWNRVLQCYVDLMPKYYKTPRTLPVIFPDGRHDYIMINAPGAPTLDYQENALQVSVEAGPNFEIQKARERDALMTMMQASPLFAQFMNEEGLGVLIDTFDLPGFDILKDKTEAFMQSLKQQKEQAQQMAQQQGNPEMMKHQSAMMNAQIKAAELQQKQKEHESRISLDMLKLKQDENKILMDLQQNKESNEVQKIKAETERFVHAIDAVTKVHTFKHNREMDHHAARTKETIHEE
jgi:hypothetical protein